MPISQPPPIQQVLQKEAASGAASIILDQGISDAFAYVDIVIPNLVKSVNENYLYLEASINGGSSWLAGTTYEFQVQFVKESNVNTSQWSYGTTLMKIGGQVGYGTNDVQYTNIIRIYDPANTNYFKNVDVIGVYGDNAPTAVVNRCGGILNTTSAINAFRLTAESGTITGDVQLIGFKK